MSLDVNTAFQATVLSYFTIVRGQGITNNFSLLRTDKWKYLHQNYILTDLQWKKKFYFQIIKKFIKENFFKYYLYFNFFKGQKILLNLETIFAHSQKIK